VRSLVQNALQSALRSANYAWATYELNHSLLIALTNEETENAWLAGEDVFNAAMVRDIPPGEMETVYDQLLEKSQLNTR
jgi:type II secretory pathway pseudopilin PulG